MIVILGGGVAGLLLGQRCKEYGKDFVILERGPIHSLASAARGAFFLHEQLPFCHESLKIKLDACPDSDARAYCRKVYGHDRLANWVSFDKYVGKEKTGWLLDRDSILDGLGDRICCGVEAYDVDESRKTIHAKDGRSWRYDWLLSTVPLPILLRMMGIWQDRKQGKLFVNLPITIRVEVAFKSNMHERETIITYCGDSEHDWYRRTIGCFHTDYEFIRRDQNGSSGKLGLDEIKVHPGKIYFDSPEQEDEVAGTRAFLKGNYILCFSRYGKWDPHHLTHQVWEEAKMVKDL